MNIKVLYFANIKEQLGLAEERVQLPHDQTIAELCQQLAARGGQWAEVFTDSESSLKMALNQEIVDTKADLNEGDEVAFFPTGYRRLALVAVNDEIIIASHDLELDSLNRQIQQTEGGEGAAVIFPGWYALAQVKKTLTGMLLEHYPGMTEKQLQSIPDEARQRWTLGRVLVAHRVGELSLGDPIVFVGVSAAHRREAFEACEFIMDYLKTRATFWKKEIYGDSAIWVEAKDADDSAAARWL